MVNSVKTVPTLASNQTSTRNISKSAFIERFEHVFMVNFPDIYKFSTPHYTYFATKKRSFIQSMRKTFLTNVDMHDLERIMHTYDEKLTSYYDEDRIDYPYVRQAYKNDYQLYCVYYLYSCAYMALKELLNM